MSVEKEMLSDLLLDAANLINVKKSNGTDCGSFIIAFNNLEATVSNIKYRQQLDEKIFKSSLKEFSGVETVGFGNTPIIKTTETEPQSRTIVNYTVIVRYDPDAVENEVLQMMGHGWMPFGGISTSFIDDNGGKSVQYVQAMVLYI